MGPIGAVRRRQGHGHRRAAVCRELTKTYEEVRRGSLQELAEWAASDVRGEITLVIGGATQPAADLHSAAEEALGLAAAGMKLRAAVAHVARQQGLSSGGTAWEHTRETPQGWTLAGDATPPAGRMP